MRINWGILGTSFISNVMADAITKEGNTQIHSVAGRSSAALQEFASTYKVAVASQDFDSVINDPLVDIIYIALPNHLHHEYTIKAAHAGKAILCEKSLSVDMQKTNTMLDVVRANNVFFLEGLMYLCHPLTERILSLIKQGEIGTVKSIQGQYCAAISQFVNPQSKGVLFNLGCYPVSLMYRIIAQQFGDEIATNPIINAIGRRGEDGNICESTAIFAFNNGVQCHLHTAEDYGLHAGFTVLGSTGSLELRCNPWLPDKKGKINLRHYEQQANVIEVDADGNGFDYQLAAVISALKNRKIQAQFPAASLNDSKNIMSILTKWQSCVATEVIPTNFSR